MIISTGLFLLSIASSYMGDRYDLGTDVPANRAEFVETLLDDSEVRERAGDDPILTQAQLDALYSDITTSHLNIITNEMALYWGLVALLLSMGAAYCLIPGGYYLYKATVEQKRMAGNIDAIDSLTSLEGVLALAKERAETQRGELERLSAEIAVAEETKPKTDEQLKRLRTALGLDEAARSSRRWGWAQVWLAVLCLAISLAVSIYLFRLAAD